MSPIVLVVGSANMDLVFRTGRIPEVGETVLGEGFAAQPGGKGANQAVAVARLGGRAAFVGCVGDDVFGAQLRQGLIEAEVDVARLRTAPGPSGTAGILVDGAGGNLIVVAPGANALVTARDVERALAVAHPAVVLAQLEIPTEAVEAASRAERFVLNPAPARALPPELVARCYAITPNESEAELLTGIAPTDDAACLRASAILLDQGAAHVAITLGERGCYLASRRGGRHLPAPSVEAIDTTAAGDAFNGALALFLAEGREMENAAALANVAGALCATRSGAQSAMPSREELRTFAGPLF